MLGTGSYHAAASGKKWIRPCYGTISGFILGIITLVIWVTTYNWRPYVDYSWQLFPLLQTISEKNGFYQPASLPYGLWYWGAILQWVFFGAVADALRCLIRFYKYSPANKRVAWRCLALIGIGWAVLMPLYLFLREVNDSELNRFKTLGDHMEFADNKYYLSIPLDKPVSVSKDRLEKNQMEIRGLIDMQDRRSKQFTATVIVSSIGLIVLSVYVFRSAKRQNPERHWTRQP